MAVDQSRKKMIDRVMGDPDLYPDEFKAWVPRWVQGNINFKLAATQLPNVENFHIVGANGEPAFAGAWVNFASATDAVASFYKDPFGRVFIRGTVKSGAIGSAIFTLPGGYRPQYTEIFAVVSNGAFGICTITSAGVVTATAGSNIYFTLNGISFRAFA